MVIAAFLELPIRTTELSDTFDASVVIVPSTWEPDYVSHPQVLYFNVRPWVPTEGNGRMNAFLPASWLIVNKGIIQDYDAT